MVRGEDLEFELPETLNLGAYLLDVNLEEGRGDKVAIHYRDRSWSFLDLWRLTNRVGNVLRDLGVEPENRVLLILGDSPDWIAAWLATMKIGGVGTHAYTYLGAHDYAYMLKLVRPKVVITDETTLDRVRDAAQGLAHPKALLIAGDGDYALREGEYSLSALVAAADETLEIEPTHRDDPAFWNFSSGTTGNPKGVPHMHRDGVVAYESFDYVLKYRADDIVLRVPKLFFHYARDHLLFSLRNGSASVLLPERTTTAAMFELIGKYRPTVLVNVPTMMRAMIQTPARDRADLGCVRMCMSSGEMLSAELSQEWVETFGGEVVNRFGSAESALGYLCNRPGAVVPGSSGTVTPLVEVKLIDDRGDEVAAGEPGRLMVRSDATGLFYVREHEKSKATFPGDEWLDTGDIFVRDENDYFWYGGRADDMVKVSGVWVSPLEIERALQENAAVAEAAVLGVDDHDGLKKIKAFVVAADGAGAAMEDELRQYCKKRLAPHKFPSVVELMDELPMTGQGKIDRKLLRKRGL